MHTGLYGHGVNYYMKTNLELEAFLKRVQYSVDYNYRNYYALVYK
jgi:hypothetical protein